MHKYSLQPTVEIKISPQINFGKCSERKGCSKSLEISKHLCKFVSFFFNLGLQFTIFDVRKNKLKKNVSFECSEIARSLPGKGPQ